MGRLEIAAAAVVEIENEVVFEDIIAAVVAELASRLIYRGTWAFEFHEGANGGFIEIDDQVLGPFEAGREPVRGAEFFVTKPAFKAKSFEDFLKRGRIG